MDLKEFAFNGRTKKKTINKAIKHTEKKREMIRMKCGGCGYTDDVPKYSPYTGHVVDSDWCYVCPNCRDQLLIVDNPDMKQSPLKEFNLSTWGKT
jgi:Zn finger protein HypA/HybF involved in hydrogenase expression